MTWFAAGLATLLAIVGLLAIPISIEVEIERTDRTRTRWQLRGLFGLVRARSDRTGAAARERQAPERPARPRHRRGAARRGRAALAALRARGFLPRAARLARDLRRQVHLPRFFLRARFGFDDPADTGQLYGALVPSLLLASASGLDVRCQPSFDDAGVEGACGATLHVRPLSVIALGLAFALSPPAIRALRAWRRAR